MIRRSDPRPGKEPAGFTQIEVLTAMLIIGVAVPLLMGGVIGSLTQERRSRDRSAAVLWAQGEIDFLRVRCYARLGPSDRKVTPSKVEPGELPPPAEFAAGFVHLEAAGPALLKGTVSLYRNDWSGATPVSAPFFTTSTYIGDVRVASQCP